MTQLLYSPYTFGSKTATIYYRKNPVHTLNSTQAMLELHFRSYQLMVVISNEVTLLTM